MKIAGTIFVGSNSVAEALRLDGQQWVFAKNFPWAWSWDEFLASWKSGVFVPERRFPTAKSEIFLPGEPKRRISRIVVSFQFPTKQWIFVKPRYSLMRPSFGKPDAKF